MSDIIKKEVKKLGRIFEINENQVIKTITELKGYQLINHDKKNDDK